MNPKNPEMTEPVFNAMSMNSLLKMILYILCTKSENIKENIPMNYVSN